MLALFPYFHILVPAYVPINPFSSSLMKKYHNLYPQILGVGPVEKYLLRIYVYMRTCVPAVRGVAFSVNKFHTQLQTNIIIAKL